MRILGKYPSGGINTHLIYYQITFCFCDPPILTLVAADDEYELNPYFIFNYDKYESYIDIIYDTQDIIEW